jgi:membrane fusion protein (multidrug efflux system)
MDTSDKKNLFSSRKVLLVFLGALSLGGAWYGLFYNKNVTEQQPEFNGVSVEVERVRSGSLTRRLTVVGSLVADKTVAIRSQVEGVISQVHVQGGEFVKEGDLLFEIDDVQFISRLKDAEARLEHAKGESGRASRLAEQKFSSVKIQDKTKADLLSAEAAVELARNNLSNTKIRAPYSGHVSMHKLSTGTLIGPSLELLTITDSDPVKVNFSIPATYLKYVSIGQPVEIKIDSFPDKLFQGRVEVVDAQVDPMSHTIALRASIPNPSNILKPGLYARVNVVMGSQDNAVICPQSALFVQGDDYFVFKAFLDTNYGIYRVARIPVSTGIHEPNGNEVEILNGLRPEDLVVTVGTHKIRDGIPVKFDFEGAGVVDPRQKEEKEKTKGNEKKS